jgi:hypothetical protein
MMVSEMEHLHSLLRSREARWKVEAFVGSHETQCFAGVRMGQHRMQEQALAGWTAIFQHPGVSPGLSF